MELRQSETIEYRALRIFLSNFYHKEVEFHSAKSSLPNIFTGSSSDNQNNIFTNRLNLNERSSKVIKLEIIDPTEKTEETSNSSNKSQQRLSSIESIIKESIEDLQNFEIISEQKDIEDLDLKIYRFNRLQRLDYLIFILKYQKQFENISQCTMIARLKNFMRPRTFKYCSQYHASFMKKYKTVENIISQILNEELFLKENEFMQEIVKIKNFFQEDLERQLKAFARKSKLTLESSDEQVLEIARTIKQELVAKMDLVSLDQQSKNSMLSQLLPFKTKQQKITIQNSIDSIKLPIELTIVFQKFQEEREKEARNPSQFEEKGSNDEDQFLGRKKKFEPKSKRKNTRKHRCQYFGIKSKKERLKEKKIEKLEKLENQRLQNSNEEVFFEPDEDFWQFNVIAVDHSESGQGQSSSENYQSINQEGRENQESANGKEKFSTKKSKIKEYQLLKQIDFKEKMESEQEQLQIQQKQIYHRKQKTNTLWTISQRMKVIAFMTVNKLTFLKGNKFDKQGITEKLSKYIGKQRSYNQCKGQIHKLKSIYKLDMNRLLNEEGEKLNINEEILQKWKKISDFYTIKNQIKIGNYSLEVNVLPMTYVMASPKEIVLQLKNLIKKGPILELQMRQVDKEEKRLEGGSKIINKNLSNLKQIKFQVKVKGCKIKTQKIVRKIVWTVKIFKK